MMSTQVYDSTRSANTQHNADNGAWIDITNKALFDAAGGVYTVANPVAAPTVAKVYELPKSAGAEFVHFGVRHTNAGATNYEYIVDLFACDVLPAAGSSYDTYVNTCDVFLTSCDIAHDASKATPNEWVFRCKRRYIVVTVRSAATSPASAVTFSFLSWSSYELDCRRGDATA